ncbi:hypothetical protein J8F10_21265 [Gemmata sp. G18]|uniref:Uncharacterized protein n=1 Tax=Gemmata palustris TaxID=2822762 RepID=A0ABS5BVN1_9BACT|nr:hypothetical protein [Gemmata palustris]MBP3957790.1 hypothetical protein [Gemmata palustris]
MREQILRELAAVDAMEAAASAAARRHGYATDDDLKVMRECATRRTTLTRLFREMEASETPDNATIWYHGDQGYSVNGRPVSVTDEEHKVLQVFAEKQTAMKRSELEEAAVISNAPRVLTKLAKSYSEAFAAAIRRPGGKGKGGYFVRVLPIGERE